MNVEGLPAPNALAVLLLTLAIVLAPPVSAQNAQPSRPPAAPAQSTAAAAPVEDASAALGAEPGVTVTRLTAPPDGHELSYYDIAAYSPITGRAYVNRHRARLAGVKPGWDILAIDLATGEQSVLVSRRPPSSAAARFDLSADGRLVSYLRINDPPQRGFDLYGYRLDRPGEFRITHADYAAEGVVVKTSPASWDDGSKRFVLVYAIGPQLYLVHEDGTSAAGNGPQPIALDDPDDGLPFHRLRLNPAFPNILFYRRDAKAGAAARPGAPPRAAMYLADLQASPPRGVPFAAAGAAAHPGWTPDGRKLAVAGEWTEYAVVDAQGRLLDSLVRQAPTRSRIGPFAGTDPAFPAAFYGTYSPDGRWIAIATRASRKARGQLFLMDSQGGNVRRLCRTDYFGRHTAGAPRIAFVGATGRLLLSTDASWGRDRADPPQVYLVDPGAKPPPASARP